MWNVNQFVPQEDSQQHSVERIADILFHLTVEEVLELPVDTLDGSIGECMVGRTAEAAEATQLVPQERSRVLLMPCLTKTFRKELEHSTELLLRAWDGGVGQSSLPQERILQRTCVRDFARR